VLYEIIKWWFVITSFFLKRLVGLKIFKRSISNLNLKRVEVTSSWFHHESWRWRWKPKIFETWKWICAKLLWNMATSPSSYVTITLRYGGFRYWLTLGIRALKAMARTGVFVLKVFALKQSFSGHDGKPALLAPHTSGPRDVSRCGALSLLQNTPRYREVQQNCC
jgi:hypothetical protein